MRKNRRIALFVAVLTLGFGGLIAFTIAKDDAPTPKSDITPVSDGWVPLPADPRWSLPPVVANPGDVPFGDGDTYIVQVDRISGNAPYSPLGSVDEDRKIAAVGDVYAIALEQHEFETLNAEGSLCVMSSVLVQLPGTDMSDLDQRMNECNHLSTVAMTLSHVD